MNTEPSILHVLIGNYPLFISQFQRIITKLSDQINIPNPKQDYKLSLRIKNCLIPKHDLKSTQFITAILNHQNQGILVYLTNVQIIEVNAVELYLKSWSQVWEYRCQCQRRQINNIINVNVNVNVDGNVNGNVNKNTMNDNYNCNSSYNNYNNGKIIKNRVSQSLLQIITKGVRNLKQRVKSSCNSAPSQRQILTCQQCQLQLKFMGNYLYYLHLGTDDLLYSQCQQIQILIPNYGDYIPKIQLYNMGNLRIFIDDINLYKFRKGDVVDLCCYVKAQIQLNKNYYHHQKCFLDVSYVSYLVDANIGGNTNHGSNLGNNHGSNLGNNLGNNIGNNIGNNLGNNLGNNHGSNLGNINNQSGENTSTNQYIYHHNHNTQQHNSIHNFIQNNYFMSRLRQIPLQLRCILNISNIKDIVCNYKSMIQSINCIKFPYLQQNSLTALKLITISSIFSHQFNTVNVNSMNSMNNMSSMNNLNNSVSNNNQTIIHFNNNNNLIKLHTLIITDQPSLIQRCIQLPDINLRRFPSIYDQKTVQQFISSSHNSIILFTNPSTKDIIIINKIIKKQLYQNHNLLVWIIAQPEENIKKKIDVKYVNVILDVTLEKNVNVCDSVYVGMIDSYLQAFIEDVDQQDQQYDTYKSRCTFKTTKKYNNINQQQYYIYNQIKQQDRLRQDKLAHQIINRYFLKSRQYKTTNINSISILYLIAESFMEYRYFILENNSNMNMNKCNQDNKTTYTNNNKRKYFSVIDAILAIFVDEQTSRNKFSSNNTLFSTDISKIMLNENNSNVSVWNYQLQNGYLQENIKYIPQDQLLSIVIQKIFNLIYEDQQPY